MLLTRIVSIFLFAATVCTCLGAEPSSVEHVEAFLQRMVHDESPMTWEEGDRFFGERNNMKLQACVELGYYTNNDFKPGKVMKWVGEEMPVYSPVWVLFDANRSSILPPKGGTWTVQGLCRAYRDDSPQEHVLVRWKDADDGEGWMMLAIICKEGGECLIVWDWSIVQGREISYWLGLRFKEREEGDGLLDPYLKEDVVELLKARLEEKKPVTAAVKDLTYKPS